MLLSPIGTLPSAIDNPITVPTFKTTAQDNDPMFTITAERGFLPRLDPLIELPVQFQPLESLLQRMTIIQPDGSQGLLAKGIFGESVLKELGDEKMMVEVEIAITSGDQNLISALFRDYSFLVSAYLLEPVDQEFRKSGNYIAGRPVLPRCLSLPIKALADKLGHYPFMEYSSSYALQNYRKVNSVAKPSELRVKQEWETSNLRVIRAFEDANGSEAGFILVHVSMVANTGRLVTAIAKILTALEARDRDGFNAGMKDLYLAYQDINKTMDTMWSWSKPADYLKFRSFIFGTSGGDKFSKMFPAGVIYESVSDQPMVFRGESGANDSIIPMADNLLEITKELPKNALTETLREFREYRPSAQREYLFLLETRATELGLAEFAKEEVSSLKLYILMVDQVREFRDRHWKFTKEYIVRRSDYPIATGGSPILAYLPQNLSVVLSVLSSAVSLLPPLSPTSEFYKELTACKIRAETEGEKLIRDVERLEKGRGAEDRREMIGGSIGCDGVG